MSKNINNILREAGILLVVAILVLTSLVMVPTTVADSSVILLEESDWDIDYSFPYRLGDGWTSEERYIVDYFGWWPYNTNHAGGDLPEVMLDFNSTLTGCVFYSDDFSTEGYIDCVLEFKSYIKYFPGGAGYSLNAGWSTDATTWYPVWSVTPTTDTPYPLVSVSLPSTAEHEPIIYIGFWVEGFNMWMNLWYIDDVKVTGEECSVESVIAAITAIWDYIDSFPDDDPIFHNDESKSNIEEHLIDDGISGPGAVLEKINNVPPQYGNAASKLGQLRNKCDGVGGGDWITDTTVGAFLASWMQEVIYCLERL